VVEVDQVVETNQATEVVSEWLTHRLFGNSVGDGQCAIHGLTVWERVAVLRRVLELEPRLARAVRHLPVYEQLKLSVELVGGAHAWDEPAVAQRVRPVVNFHHVHRKRMSGRPPRQAR